ncbi:retention module-containing protein [Parashewanella curva]|uniref:Retention module-containing protein n=1 Tax=Parashewanella curva TaxID=2338552 RepID=A0A3L8PY76_9GAMM|nr:retention module-containing protein [Parashewanella curva]RLV60291.1 retention module-containing protein [Parashewanella curva]
MKRVFTTQAGSLSSFQGRVSIEINGLKVTPTIGLYLPTGSLITFSDDATFEIEFQDGSQLTQQSQFESAPGVEPLDEIEALQQLIADGEDPTEDLPETAAGGNAGRQGDDGFISVDRAGAETLASAGFDTGFTPAPATVQQTQQNIQINDDQPSQLINDQNVGSEDANLNGNVLSNDSDPDSQLAVVNYQVNGQTIAAGNSVTIAGGIFTLLANGSYTFSPGADWNGTLPSITYTTNTGATASLSLSVTAVNDAPVANDDVISTNEDTPVTINVLSNDSDVDGDTLTITSATVDASQGTVAIDNGQLVFNPVANFNGTATISYTIIDGKGGTDTATVTVNVNPANDAPDAVDDEITTDEDTPVTINVLSNDSDVDGDTLTITGANVDANQGTVTVVDGELVFTPAENFNGTATISYTISDGKGGTDTATVTVNVNPANDAPDAVNDAITTDEDTPVTIDVLSNDSDVDGDSLTISNPSVDAAQGSVQIVNGRLLFTPAENFNGTATISYTISDGNGGTDTATVTVNVNPANDAPDAVNDAITTDEDTPVTIDVLSNDSDVDGDSLTITGATVDAAQGTVTIDNGQLVFNPVANFNGTATISYIISDGNGGTDTATVTVNVNAVNDDPTDLTLSNTSVAENAVGAIIGAVGVNDVDDGDTHTYSVSDDRFEVINGQLKLKDGQSLDHETADSLQITITATDSGGLQTQQTFTINVGDVNETPTDLTLSNTSVAENTAGAIIGAVGVNDVDDGDTHTYSVSDDRFEVNNGQLKLKDGQSLDHEETDSLQITITATDSGGLQTQQTFTINVGDSDEIPPLAPTVNSQVTNDTTPTISGTVTLETGGRLEVVVNGQTYTTDNGLTVNDDGTWSLTLPETAAGTYDVTATAYDAAGNPAEDSTSGELTIDTTAPAAPTVTNMVTNDTTPTISGTVTLETGGRLEVVVNGQTYTTDNGLTVNDDGTWSLTLPETAAGTYDVTATAYDAAGNPAEDSTSGELTIDTTAPTMSFTPKSNLIAFENFEHFDKAQGASFYGGYRDGAGNGGVESGYQNNTQLLDGWSLYSADLQEDRHGSFGQNIDIGEIGHHLDLAGRSNGSATQTLSNLIDGNQYTLSLDMKSRGTGHSSPNESIVQLIWNGTHIATINPFHGSNGISYASGINPADFPFEVSPVPDSNGWYTYSVTLTADGSTNALKLQEVGGGQSYGGTVVDNVKWAAVSSNSDEAGILAGQKGAIVGEFTLSEDIERFEIEGDSQNRFEIIHSNGKYLIKLKGDKSLAINEDLTLSIKAIDAAGNESEPIQINVHTTGHFITANIHTLSGTADTISLSESQSLDFSGFINGSNAAIGDDIRVTLMNGTKVAVYDLEVLSLGNALGWKLDNINLKNINGQNLTTGGTSLSLKVELLDSNGNVVAESNTDTADFAADLIQSSKFDIGQYDGLTSSGIDFEDALIPPVSANHSTSRLSSQSVSRDEAKELYLSDVLQGELIDSKTPENEGLNLAIDLTDPRFIQLDSHGRDINVGNDVSSELGLHAGMNSNAEEQLRLAETEASSHAQDISSEPVSADQDWAHKLLP